MSPLTGLQGWPFVSVVAPVWNVEKTLERCVDGVLSQDYPQENVEVIFVDNRSRDRSLQILEQYKGRIIIVEEKKQGAGAARNAGVKKAKHDYVAFIDADCVPDKRWLRELVRAARCNPGADFIGGRIAAWRPQSEIEKFVETLYDQHAAIASFQPPAAITANLLIKRAKLFDLGLFDEKLLRGQDVDLSYRGFFFHQSQFAYAPGAVVYHRNTKTLSGLFHKGFQHGKAASQVVKRYSTQLQISRFRRCLQMKPYWRFLSTLPHYVKCTNRCTDGDAAHEVGNDRHAFYEAVFQLGKQCGFITTTIRYG